MMTQVTPSRVIFRSGTQRSPRAKPIAASMSSTAIARYGDSAMPAWIPMAL